MKYVKSILIIAITASVAGFVVWHLMWMKGIEKKFNEEQSSGVVNIVEIKERKSEGKKGKTGKNMPVGEEEIMSVKDSGTQISQTGAKQQETEMRGGSKSDAADKLPVEKTKSGPVKEDGMWFEKDIGLGKKQQEVKPEPGKTTTEIPIDKPISVTINNKANPVMQKNIPKPQSIKRPDGKVTGVTPYPTSTAP